MTSLTEILLTLTAEERVEVDTLLDGLRECGYKDRELFGELAPGVRIRHRAHRWPEALDAGTGVIVAITERNPSSWSQSWGMPDVEMVVAFDKPSLPGSSRLSTLAQYHVDTVGGAA